MPPPASIRRAALVGALLALLAFAALLSGGAPGGLVERGPFSSDFFDAQAHALLDGHLDVDPAVASIEGFDHDGRTYLYFGLVPSLLRLPVAAATDSMDGRLTQLSMLLALAVALSATTQLVWRARCWRRGADLAVRRWEPAVVGGFVATVGLASPLLFLASRPVVYHEVELWGTATTLAALNAILRWWERPTRRQLALASLAALVALNTRASVGGGAVAALGLVVALSLLWRIEPWRHLPVLALAVLVPVATYAAVNLARFDTPFSVPFEEQVLSRTDAPRQAAMAATDGSMFGTEFAPSALATYLRPDGVSVQRLFPWVTFRERRTIVGHPTFDTVDRAASLPVVAPTLLLLAAVGVVSMLRRRDRSPWLAVTVGAATGLVSTVTIAFIANRYLADFTPTLVVPAAVGTWVLADRLARGSRRGRHLARLGFAALTLVAVGVSTALALQSQRLFILPSLEDRRGFVSLQYDLDHALHDGPPPAVHRAGALGSPGPRGNVAVVGACTGVYWSDAHRWWPLELGDDRAWSLTGDLPDGPSTVLEGDRWRIVATEDGARVRVRYEADDGTVRVDAPVELAAGIDHHLAITLDTVNHELLVRLDGRTALAAAFVDLEGRSHPGAGWISTPVPTPLCDELVGRLDP